MSCDWRRQGHVNFSIAFELEVGFLFLLDDICKKIGDENKRLYQ